MAIMPNREYWQALLSKKSPAILVLAVLVGLAIRVPGMDRSLGHDEAFTLEAFASQPYARIATSYAAPNNHIFHSLLVRLSTRSLGKDNWTARLPAFAAGVISIPVIWAVGRALCGTSAAGLIAAWILALIPVHQHYSQTSRGYSLLMLLGLLSLWAAQSGVRRGRRRSWAAFGICSFLMAWTIPSGIFHLLALTLWATLLTSGPSRRLPLLTGLLSGTLVLLAYVPVWQELASAGQRWGVDIWQDPLALVSVFQRAVEGWVGGWSGLLPAVAALAGLVGMIRNHRQTGLYIVLSWGVACAAGLAMGVAGQPRTYFFLLPTFVLAAAYGLCRTLSADRWRVIAATALLAGYGWIGARALGNTPQRDPFADLAAHLEVSTQAGDIVVTPSIMDVRVWPHARDTIGQRLLDALQGQGVHRLLFVTSTADDRFGLGNYLLKTNAAPSSIALPEQHFESLQDLDHVRVWQLRSTGVPIFATNEQSSWHSRVTNSGQELSVSTEASVIGNSLTIEVLNPNRTPFQLYSSATFATAKPGIILLVYAKTFRQSYVSIYSLEQDGHFARPHMYRTATWPAPARGRDQSMWFVDAYLLPVAGQQEYGIYVLGAEDPQQRFSDIACYFFAYPD